MNPQHDDKLQELIEFGRKKGSLSLAEIRKKYPPVAKSEEELNKVIQVLKENQVIVLQKSNLREWVESIIIAVCLALFIRTFFFQAYKIPSGSMRMTLIEGDRLFVNKLRYGPKVPFTSLRIQGYAQAQRGDIIVFLEPVEKKKDFIKRLIAFGGETVEIRDGHVYINGELVNEPTIRNNYYYNRGEFGREGQAIRIPQGHVFVLGDNSSSSSDSRYWGFVPEKNIIGQAKIIFWPLNRIRWIQ